MNVKNHLTVAQPACFSSAVAGKPPAAFFEYIFGNTGVVLPEGHRNPGRFAAIPFLTSPSSGPPDTFAGPPAVAAVGLVRFSGWVDPPGAKPPSRSTGRAAASPPAGTGVKVSPVRVFPASANTQPGYPNSRHLWFDNWHNPAGRRYGDSFSTPFPGQFHDLPPGVIIQAGPYRNNLLKFMLKSGILQYANGGILAVFGQYRFLIFS